MTMGLSPAYLAQLSAALGDVPQRPGALTATPVGPVNTDPFGLASMVQPQAPMPLPQEAPPPAPARPSSPSKAPSEMLKLDKQIRDVSRAMKKAGVMPAF